MRRLFYSKEGRLYLSVGILLLMFGLAVHSLKQKSPTFDEQAYILRGLGYLRGENTHMRVGHPLGLNALSALFLVGDEKVKLPTDDPSWQLTSFHRPSELFMWEIGNDVAHIMFLARLPTVFLGLILVSFAGRWAWELSGKRPLAGVLALFLLALDPNILAHTRLTTTDLGLAAGALVSGYMLWRYFERPSWKRAAAFGVAFGLLQNTKFTAGLFVPLFALVIVVGILVFVGKEEGRLVDRIRIVTGPLVTLFPLTAFLTLWAAYGFDVSTLPESLPTFSQLGGRTLPLAHHLEQLLDIGGRVQKSTPAFLLGDYSDNGWWYYFPITFLLKTPLPVLLLMVWSGVMAGFDRLSHQKKPGFNSGVATIGFDRLSRRGGGRLGLVDTAALLIPAGGYFAIALTTDINIGYRHLLPVLPFFTVFIAAVLVPAVEKARLSQYGLVVLAGWLGLVTLWIAPDYLAFFNVLAGGPNNGWRALVDSNLDWGQDLPGLKEWMDENGVNEVWLSYFGEARPEYYGISYRGLDSNPPRLMNPLARPFSPHNPAPGYYAISATTLQGVHFENHDLFAWFRDKEPVAKIGYSIFLYDVQSDGNQLDVALGNVQLDEIAEADFEQLATNDIVPRWFDPNVALPLMQGDESVIILPQDWAFSGPLAMLFGQLYQTDYQGQSISIARPFTGLDTIEWLDEETAVFTLEEGKIGLRGYEVPDTQLVPGGSLVVLTVSEQMAVPQNAKMFLHLTTAEDEIVAQWDGLGIYWQSWMVGDLLFQQHVLDLPPSLPHGELTLWAGYYNPETAVRWRIIDRDLNNTDRLPLETLTFQ